MGNGTRWSKQRWLNEFVYALCIFVACIAMQTAEIGISHWQYWVLVGCVCAARMVGYVMGSAMKMSFDKEGTT